MNPKICPDCQHPIPAQAPGGFCPACVLRDADEPPPPGRAAPALAEVAAAFPQFEILSLIGQGGMGSVFKVRQPELDRLVALKILCPELGRDPAFAERFAREARVLAKLNHPNIVTVFEHGASGGFFYLLMQYVDGVNLRQAMRAGRFTPEQALAVVPGICDALQAAHAQGVWHRDIKPENILLDAQGTVKIVDFGIARLVGDPAREFTLTRTGAALGSAPYMAPEQHEKPHEVDHRADIYSLGVVIYEMLTGELPLGRFPAPSQRAAVSARIDEIVFQTLEKERELRQQSANEVKTDVHRAMRPEVGVPGPCSAPAPTSVGSLGLESAFRTVAWSVGLWIGGIAALVAGVFTSPLLLGLGCVAAVLGLAGSGWTLLRIRRGLHPKAHRMPLLIIVYWPVVAALSWASVIAWFSVLKRPPDIHPSLASALYGYALVAITAPLLAARMLWKVFCADPSPAPRHLREWGQVALACVLAAGAVGLAKFVIQRETDYLSYKAEFIQIYGDIQQPEEPDLARVRDAVDQALGEHRANYRIHVYGSQGPTSPWRFTGSPSPYVVLECRSLGNDASQYHFNQFAKRLRASLPNRIEINSGAGGVSGTADPDAPPSIQQGYRHVRWKNVILLLLPVAVVLLVTAIARPLLWLPAVLALLSSAAFERSAWPGSPEDLPPSIEGLQPLPPLPAPEYDFSTTRDAVESLIKAAKQQDVEGFKRGISAKLLEKSLAEDPDLAEPMRDWGKLSYRAQLSRNGDAAMVRLINNVTKYTCEFPMVRENAEWKIDLPKPVATAPQSTPTAIPPGVPQINPPAPPKLTAEEVFRKMVAAANASDGEEFVKHASKSTSVISLGSPPPVASRMAPFFGEILLLKPLPPRHNDRTDSARLIARMKAKDASIIYREFQFTIQGGQWKFLTDGLPQYRASCRIEFHPDQGKAESILKLHLGEIPFTPVAGADGQFDIGGEEFSADAAVQIADRNANQLLESLKKAGLDPFFKIIQHAKTPDTPWLGEDPSPAEKPTP
ncbi:MAG: serine/threonine-protein kinase [Verrucomicrobia bacterium]|nr:serine/threonine-protein kinase [Verrucomicrobiota bacterium]